MKKYYFYTLTVVLFLYPSFGFCGLEVKNIPDFCIIKNPYSIRKQKINGKPIFFFSNLFGSNYVFHSLQGDGNKAIDMETGKVLQLPGKYDAVPTLDGDILTTPSVDESTGKIKGGMLFYDLKKIMSENDKPPKPIFEDEDLRGLYQSIGEISRTSNSSHIKVITDADGLSYRDYEVKRKNDGSLNVTALKDVGVLCEGRSIRLPMMSKDGRFLAAIDRNMEDKTTRIFNIENGGCEEIKDTKMKTGKADFSFDGKKIVFRVMDDFVQQRVLETDGQYEVMPKGTVLVYDLETGETKRIADTSASPRWKKNGTVVYIERKGKEEASFFTAEGEVTP